MPSEPNSSRRQALEEKAVALLSQDVDRLSAATQRSIPAGELLQARENLTRLKSRLHEVEELLGEIEQSESQPAQPTSEPSGGAQESEKRDRRVLQAPCQACGQVYPLRLYKTGWRYRWLCYRCRPKQVPVSDPPGPGNVDKR